MRISDWSSDVCSSDLGHIPRDWFAQQIARLDSVQGDIDTLSGRIAAARTWSYIAHRADWLAHPAEMAERTSALAAKTSEALHDALTQRFVENRKPAAMGKRGPVGVDLGGRRINKQ